MVRIHPTCLISTPLCSLSGTTSTPSLNDSSGSTCLPASACPSDHFNTAAIEMCEGYRSHRGMLTLRTTQVLPSQRHFGSTFQPFASHLLSWSQCHLSSSLFPSGPIFWSFCSSDVPCKSHLGELTCIPFATLPHRFPS